MRRTATFISEHQGYFTSAQQQLSAPSPQHHEIVPRRYHAESDPEYLEDEAEAEMIEAPQPAQILVRRSSATTRVLESSLGARSPIQNDLAKLTRTVSREFGTTHVRAWRTPSIRFLPPFKLDAV